MSRRLLHLDAFSGAAGNMFMGAMLDLGLPRARLLEGLAPLGLDFKLVVRKVQRSGLAARYVDVVVPQAKRARAGRRRGPSPRRKIQTGARSAQSDHAHPHSPRAWRSGPRPCAHTHRTATPTAAATPRSAA